MLTLKRFTSVVLAGVLGLSVLTACATPVATGGEPGQTRNTIAVSGSGQAFGRPDLATIQIGVQTRDADAGRAVAQNNQQADAILAALKALGVEDKDLQTSNFSVNAQRDYDPATGQQRDTITYYVDNTLSVTVRDLNKLGEVLGKAVDAGANNVYGISFGVSDPAALEAEARAEAMADARARAEQLAQAAGVTLGSPITISESFNFAPPVPFAFDRAAAAEVAASVPVATGQLQVSIQVSVAYEIR
jgi:hypothetical protein